MKNFDTLSTLLAEKKYPDFIHELDRLYPSDAADFLDSLPPEELPVVFRLLKKDTASEIFAELDSESQKRLISALTDRELGQLCGDLYTDDVVDMLEELPAGVVSRIMKNVSPDDRSVINRFLAYPDGSAGSIMTSEYATLHSGMTISGAIHPIRKTGFDKETVYTLFVTDGQRHLVGTLELSDLLFGEPQSKISDVTDTDAASVLTTDDREYVADVIARYDLLSVPVVDSEGRLVGIVTVDDAVDVMREEATEDIEKMAAITPSEPPYLRAKTLEIWKQRIPWLLLLMVSATFTGMIISGFEQALAAQAALIAFIPMLMDTGGNCGSQASVTVIRGMSLGEIELSDVLRVMWKEIRVSLMCGGVLGAVAFAKIMLVDGLLMGNPGITVPVAAVVCATLVCTVVLAKLVGCTLPMAAKKLGFDPAVMASPFITTIVDALSLLLYFQIASLLLGV